MPSTIRNTLKMSLFRNVSKGVAVVASTGAALVSIVTALYSYGVIGHSESHRTIGNYGAAWVRLKPGVDTATAIGDTVPFAATIADKNGSILVGTAPTWTTGDSAVAIVTPTDPSSRAGQARPPSASSSASWSPTRASSSGSRSPE